MVGWMKGVGGELGGGGGGWGNVDDLNTGCEFPSRF